MKRIKKSLSALKQIWFPETVVENDVGVKLVSLSPYSDCNLTEESRAQAYFSAINNALQNDTVYNVGIVGTYGSGKSSIIQSFQRNKAEKYHFQNISLANFTPKKEGEEINRLLEFSILQQLLYHVDPAKLPHSRFNRIHHKISYWRIIVVAALFFISLLVIVEPWWLNNSILKDITEWNEKRRVIVVAVIAFMFSGSCILMMVIRFFKTNKLSKIGVKQAEIEIGMPDERSVLNRHLDEILYYFIQKDTNVLVIEDLDRFEEDSIPIFSKLREINLLINNCESVKSKRNGRHRVVFVYAIKDDLFKNPKDRVKFFDILIPIVPFVDAYNSTDAFCKLLARDGGITLDDRVIYDTLIFVDDMRLLKNIYNELVIYEKNVGSHNGKLRDSIFAMIVYKNMYPDDYGKIHSKGSILNELFSPESKQKMIAAAKQDRESAIRQKEEEIEFRKKKHPEKILSLRDEYVRVLIEYFNVKYAKYKRTYEKVTIDDGAVTYEELKSDELFDALVEHGVSKYAFNAGGTNYGDNVNISFAEIEKMLGHEKSYAQRHKDLIDHHKYEVSSREMEISLLKRDIEGLNKRNLSELSGIVDLDDVFDMLKPREFRLLVTLLRKGYIKEDFVNYISLFVEGRLSRADREFIMKKAAGEEIGFDFVLDNPEILVEEEMREYELDDPKNLNYDTLKVLLERERGQVHRLDSTELSRSIRSFFKLPSERQHEFIEGYCRSRDDNSNRLLVNSLLQYDDKTWDKICDNAQLPEIEKWEVFLNLLEFGDKTSIEKLAKDEALVKFVTKTSEILNVVDGSTFEPAKQLLDLIKPRFDWNVTPIYLDDGPPRMLFEYVYERDMYALTANMIVFMMRAKAVKFDLERFTTQCYTHIKNSACSNLIEYVDNNIEEFIKSVYLNISQQQNEELLYFIELCGKISDSDVLNAVVEKTTVMVRDINEVPSSIWDRLFEMHRAFPNKENTVAYYRYSGCVVNTILDEWLKYYFRQDERRWLKAVGSFVSMYDRYLAIDILNDDFYPSEVIVPKFLNAGLEITRADIRELSKKKDGKAKLIRLIDFGVIKLMPKTFSALKEYAEPLHIDLLLEHPNAGVTFAEKQKSIVNTYDKILLLRSGKLNMEQKLQILNTIPLKSSLADELSEFVLDLGVGNFRIEDIFGLLSKMNNEVQIARILIASLSNWSDLGPVKIMDLLARAKGDIKILAEQKKKVSIPVTEESHTLARLLQDQRFIENYQEKRGKLVLQKV